MMKITISMVIIIIKPLLLPPLLMLNTTTMTLTDLLHFVSSFVYGISLSLSYLYMFNLFLLFCGDFVLFMRKLLGCLDWCCMIILWRRVCLSTDFVGFYQDSFFFFASIWLFFSFLFFIFICQDCILMSDGIVKRLSHSHGEDFKKKSLLAILGIC